MRSMSATLSALVLSAAAASAIGAPNTPTTPNATPPTPSEPMKNPPISHPPSGTTHCPPGVARAPGASTNPSNTPAPGAMTGMPPCG